MKRVRYGGRARAFTLLELLCVVGIIAILAAILLPALSQGGARAKRIQCVNNLRQIGLAFHTFAHEHNGQFPMAVPASAGGSLEFIQNGYKINGEFYFAFRHFQVLASDLVTPKVVVCPTAVPRESPESYYSVAERLSHEIPGAFQPNQYFNQANPQAHYETTGPEIWQQTEGSVDVVVGGLGTGGTITGVARFLKEQKPAVMIVGADPEGSLYSGDTIKPYKVEGIGEDFIPGTIDLKLIDRIIQVNDRDSFLTARRITREEGILVGGSSGTAMKAAMEVAHGLDEKTVMVVILPDTGRNNLSKIYNDEWMRQNGFFERFPRQMVHDVVAVREREMPELITVSSREKVGRAIDLLQEYGISQMPVTEDGSGAGKLVGSIQERTLLDRVYRDPGLIETTVGAAMDGPFPTIAAGAHVDEAFNALLGGVTALVVMDAERPVGIITRVDLLEFMAHTRASR